MAITVHDDAAVVTCHGELDSSVSDLDDALHEARRAGHDRIVVDLLDVTFVDSSVVRSLVTAYLGVRDRDGWVRVVYTHHMIGRVLEICGLSEQFPRYADLAAALRGAPGPADVVEGSA